MTYGIIEIVLKKSPALSVTAKWFSLARQSSLIISKSIVVYSHETLVCHSIYICVYIWAQYMITVYGHIYGRKKIRTCIRISVFWGLVTKDLAPQRANCDGTLNSVAGARYTPPLARVCFESCGWAGARLVTFSPSSHDESRRQEWESTQREQQSCKRFRFSTCFPKCEMYLN